MNTTRILTTTAAAAALVGAIGLAYAQTTNGAPQNDPATMQPAPVTTPSVDPAATMTSPAMPAVTPRVTAPAPTSNANAPIGDTTAPNSNANATTGNTTAPMVDSTTERAPKADRG